MSTDTGTDTGTDVGWARFAAEAAYADSIVRTAIGDVEATIACLEQSLEACPPTPPRS